MVNVTLNTYFLIALNKKIQPVSSPDFKSIQSSEHSNPQLKENWVKDFMLLVCAEEALSVAFIDC